MKKTVFIIETYNQYLTRILDDLRKGKLTGLKISTMNLFAEQKTLVHNFLSEVVAANQKSPNNFLVYHSFSFNLIFRHCPHALSTACR